MEIFAIRQLKKLKLVFKNAAKVIDPVVILFSADKEISGTESVAVCVGSVAVDISLSPSTCSFSSHRAGRSGCLAPVFVCCGVYSVSCLLLEKHGN